MEGRLLAGSHRELVVDVRMVLVGHDGSGSARRRQKIIADGFLAHWHAGNPADLAVHAEIRDGRVLCGYHGRHRRKRKPGKAGGGKDPFHHEAAREVSGQISTLDSVSESHFAAREKT